MAKKTVKKTSKKKKEEKSVVPKHLFIPIVVSIFLSIGAMVVAFGALSGIGGVDNDSDNVEDVDIIDDEGEEFTFDLELIQRILETSPSPNFVTGEDNSYIAIMDALTGESARITDDDNSGYVLYAVPGEFDGRIFITRSEESRNPFAIKTIDLYNLEDLYPVALRSDGFSDYSFMNILSPSQRYVASVSDEYLSRDHRELLVITDLLGERHRTTVIRPFDERITSVDGDPYGLPEDRSQFSLNWVSEECIEFSVYDNLTEEPRAELRLEEVCVLEDLDEE